MIKRDIKTLLKIHSMSIKVLHLLQKFTGKTLVGIKTDEDKWMNFQKDYIKLVEEHDLAIEEEMLWAVMILNVGVHRIFDVETEYDPKLKKYGIKYRDPRNYQLKKDEKSGVG